MVSFSWAEQEASSSQSQKAALLLLGQQQEGVEEAVEAEGVLQPLRTLAEVEAVVEILDLVVEEAETGPHP